LEEIIGREVTSFCYPFGMKGYYNKKTIRLVKEAGYKCADSLIAGLNTKNTDRFNLRRMGVAPDISFKNACDGL